MGNSDWKKDFYKMYSKGKVDEVADLIMKNAPQSLLKFSSIDFKDGNSVYLETIKKSEIWLSNPNEFNDPFDCAMLIGNENINVNDIEIKTAKVFDSIKRRVYISCFAEPKLLKKPLMWSHYAEKHKGICLEYDFSEIIIQGFKIYPVIYKSVFKDLDEAFKKNINEFTVNAIYTKALDWRYESEWRLMEFKETEDKGYKKKFIKPKRIYIGCKNESKEVKESLVGFCKVQNIELYQMKMEPNSFNLTYYLVSTQ